MGNVPYLRIRKPFCERQVCLRHAKRSQNGFECRVPRASDELDQNNGHRKPVAVCFAVP